MKILIGAVALVVVAIGSASAQTTQPTPPPLDSERLERKLLMQRVERQEQEIAALKAQLAALAAQLEALGMRPQAPLTPAGAAPAASPTTNLAHGETERSRRVVFVLATDGRDEKREILRAVGELQPGHSFNVVVLTGDSSTPLENELVAATDANKKKLQDFLQRSFSISGKWLTGFDVALRWQPQEIWFINSGGAVDDEEALLRDLHKLNATAEARINTTIAYSRYAGPRFQHALWRIAAETGGVCVDAKGNPIDEPVLPIAPAAKPETLPPPSILRSRKPQ